MGPLSSFSNELQDLMKNMLHRDQKNRFSAAQVLGHAWFDGETVAQIDLNQPNSNKSSVADVIGKYKAFNKEARATRNFMSRCCHTTEDMKKLRTEMNDALKGKKLEQGD